MDICAVSMQITVFGIVFASKYMLKSNAGVSLSGGGGGASSGGDGGSSGGGGDAFDAGGAAPEPDTTESVFDSAGG